MTEENRFPVKKITALYGSLVYLICKEEGMSRPVKEFLAALGGEVTKSDLSKCMNFIKSFMKEKNLMIITAI